MTYIEISVAKARKIANKNIEEILQTRNEIREKNLKKIMEQGPFLSRRKYSREEAIEIREKDYIRLEIRYAGVALRRAENLLKLCNIANDDDLIHLSSDDAEYLL